MLSVDRTARTAPMHRQDHDQSIQSTPVLSVIPQRFPPTKPLQSPSKDPRTSRAMDTRNGLDNTQRYSHVAGGQLDGASPEVERNETSKAALHLSNDIQRFASVIAGTTSEAMSLETRETALRREFEVYNQWQERTGNLDKFSDSEKQEVIRIDREIKDIQNQVSQQEIDRNRAGHDFATSLRSLVLGRLESIQVDRDGVLDSQIQRLNDENRSLKQTLDRTNKILEAQENRLKAVEDQRHEQSKNKSNLADKAQSDPDTAGTGTDLKLLQDHWNDFRVQLTKDFDHLREEVVKRDTPTSQLLGIEDRLTQCERRLRDSARSQDLGQVQNFLEEMRAKYDKMMEDVNSRVNQLLSTFSADVESSRTNGIHITELAASIESVKKDIEILTNEMSDTAQGFRSKVIKLEERMQQTCNDWSGTSKIVQEIRNRNLDPPKDVLDAVQLRLAKAENTLEQHKTSLTETDTNSLKIASDTKSQFEKVSTDVDSIQTAVTRLEKSMQETKALAKPKECVPQSSNENQPQRGWEVDEGRHTAPSVVLGPLDTQEMRQKMSAIENFVIAHEQRLNTFTLEPFLRSIVHQMRIMYPYPDNVSRNIDAIRVTNQQLATQVSEAQGRLARIENDLKGKAASVEVLTELQPHLNQVQKDIDALKAGVGELSSRTRKQAQELQKQSGTTPFEGDLAEDKMEKIQEHILNRIRSLNGVNSQISPADPQSEAHTNYQIAMSMKKLEDFVEETKTRLNSFDKKMVDEARIRHKLREDTTAVIEAIKTEYDEEIVKLRDILDQIQEDGDSASANIKELQDNFVQTYGDLQSQVAVLQLQAKPKGSLNSRTSFSPAQRSDSSNAQSSLHLGKQAQAQLGQVNSSTGRSFKRKRAVTDTSDSDDVQNSHQR